MIFDRLLAVTALAHELDLRISRQQRAQPGPCDRLIIDDHGPKHFRHDSAPFNARSCQGKTTVATAPPPGTDARERLAASP